MEVISRSDVIPTYRSEISTLDQGSASSALNKLENCKALSTSGKNWFITATDPFHDDRVTLAGYPDTNTSGSIVQCIKQSVQVVCPSTLSGQNWDLNIVDWPSLTQNIASSNLTQEFQIQVEGVNIIDPETGNIPFTIGGISAMAGVSGQQLYGSQAGQYTIDAVDVPLTALNQQYFTGPCRVVAKGFEVTNTTAALTRQGQVTVWRQPTPSVYSTDTQLFYLSTGIAPRPRGYLNTYQMLSPPPTLAASNLLEGTETWPAEQGCYVVGTMNDSNNPALESGAVMVLVDDVDPRSTGSAYPQNAVGTRAVAVSIGTGDSTYTVPGADLITPFNLSGAYFTGLSPETTLQVTSKVYIERFPDPSQTDLVVLANPSPGYDPCALELYARTISQLPVGVPQGENSLGDWFKGVVQKVSSFATPILKTLAPIHPVIGGAAALSGAAKAFTAPGESKKAKALRRISELVNEEDYGMGRRNRRKKKKRTPPPVPSRAGRRAIMQ